MRVKPKGCRLSAPSKIPLVGGTQIVRVKPKGCRLSAPSKIPLVGGTQIVRVKPKDVGYRLLLRYLWSEEHRL